MRLCGRVSRPTWIEIVRLRVLRHDTRLISHESLFARPYGRHDSASGLVCLESRLRHDPLSSCATGIDASGRHWFAENSRFCGNCRDPCQPRIEHLKSHKVSVASKESGLRRGRSIRFIPVHGANRSLALFAFCIRRIGRREPDPDPRMFVSVPTAHRQTRAVG